MLMATETNITELEEAYKKFLRLYERFAADRLTISKQGETLGKIIDELKAESLLATEFKVQVRKGILESVEKITRETDCQPQIKLTPLSAQLIDPSKPI
jgi:hypothetical protein